MRGILFVSLFFFVTLLDVSPSIALEKYFPGERDGEERHGGHTGAHRRGARHIHHHGEHWNSHGDHLFKDYGNRNYTWRADWPTNDLGLGYETTNGPRYQFNPYYYYNGVQVTPAQYYDAYYDYYYGDDEAEDYPEYEYYLVPVLTK